MQVQLVSAFTVSANGYCHFSREINHYFLEMLSSGEYKNAGFSKLETRFFHFCPLTQRSL